MPLLIAIRPLSGSWGIARPGATFECDAETAQSLVARGVARHAAKPKIEYETRVVTPEAPEVSADSGHPFRDVPVHHPEPPDVAAASDSVFSAADVPLEKPLDTERRRGRPRSGAR